MDYKSIKLVALFTSLSFLLAPLCSHAELTSKDLLENCQVKVKLDESKSKDPVDPVEAFEAGACTGYIKGFDDMEIIYASILAGPNSNEEGVKKYSLYCLPGGTKNVQMAKTFIDYVQAHPDEMKEDASLTLARAFRAAYPCPKQ